MGKKHGRTVRLKFEPTRCFVLTVRDPAERLESGYRSSDATNGRLARMSGEAQRRGERRNLSHFVSDLRRRILADAQHF